MCWKTGVRKGLRASGYEHSEIRVGKQQLALNTLKTCRRRKGAKPYPEQGHDASEVEQAQHAGDDDCGERVEGHVLEDRGEGGF